MDSTIDRKKRCHGNGRIDSSKYSMISSCLVLFLVVTVCLRFSPYSPSSSSAEHPIQVTRRLTSSDSGTMPIFYINLDRSEGRRKFMEDQLTALRMDPNVTVHRRVRAINHVDVLRVQLDVRSLVVPNLHELACISSHLLAIHHAINDDAIDPNNPYAMIMEDDISLQFNVDFMELAKSAPADFGILQITTSNSVEVQRMWEIYRQRKINSTFPSRYSPNNTLEHMLWHPYKIDDGLWSTQAYIIRKAHVKEFTSKVVKLKSPVPAKGAVAIPTIRLIHPNKAKYCTRAVDGTCYLPFRIVADMYLYAAMAPVYTLRIPIFESAKVGQNTTIPTTNMKDQAARLSAAEVAATIELVKGNSSLLPPFVRVPLQPGQLMSPGKSHGGDFEKRRFVRLRQQQLNHPH